VRIELKGAASLRGGDWRFSYGSSRAVHTSHEILLLYREIGSAFAHWEDTERALLDLLVGCVSEADFEILGELV
jgi:hypothetical protein